MLGRLFPSALTFRHVTKQSVGLELAAADLGSVRFAISPIGQLVGVLTVMSGRGMPAGLEEWRAAHAGRFDALRHGDPLLAAVAEILRVTTYVPDCLSAPPLGTTERLRDELERLRAGSADALRADLRRSVDRRRPGTRAPELDAARGPDLPDRLAASLSAAWAALLGDMWPALKAVLEQDIEYRGRLLSTHGLARALDELDPGVRWRDDGQLEFTGRAGESHRPSGVGLWLLPNAFGGNWLCLAPPSAYALTYPARGTGSLLAPSAAPAPAPAVRGLIGSSRARILHRLREPATTTQLAAELEMTIGAVGDHLAVLRDNRLVDRRRAGRSVLYTRTELARTLLREDEDDDDAER
jgi:DNA-binding transcriptional ArsR family regulator